MSYKKIVLTADSYKTPVCNLLEFYEKLGILDVVRNTIKELNIDLKKVCTPYYILANNYTDEKIRKCIEETWEYYSVDRFKGEFRKDPSLYKRKKTKKALTKSDIAKLSMHYLNWGVHVDEKVPNDEIWINLDIKER